MMCEYVVQRAAANLPQSATHTLFRVDGGNVLLLGVVGTVTSVIQAQSTPCSLSVDQAVTLASPNVNGFSSGSLVGFGLADSNKVADAGFESQAAYVLAAGAEVLFESDVSSTGQMRWTLWYRPLDPGASVVAV